jgi:hypothetical protein
MSGDIEKAFSADILKVNVAACMQAYANMHVAEENAFFAFAASVKSSARGEQSKGNERDSSHGDIPSRSRSLSLSSV